MNPARPEVFVVDDDAAVRDAIALLLRGEGFAVRTFPDARAFLDRADADAAGCVVLDIRMPGLDGLELQARLNGARSTLALVIVTGHGDVPAAVRALKAGAVDFIEKPFEPQTLLAAVRRALAASTERRDARTRGDDARARLDRLTPREREVMTHVAAGEPNKVIAGKLGISERTVELHRGRVMRKLAVRSVPELVWLIEAGDRSATRRASG